MADTEWSWPLIQVELAAAKESAAEAPPEPRATAAKKTGVSREQQLRSVEKFPEELRRNADQQPYVKTMSKAAYVKASTRWIKRYEEGKCSAEHCISKLKALLNKYCPL